MEIQDVDNDNIGNNMADNGTISTATNKVAVSISHVHYEFTMGTDNYHLMTLRDDNDETLTMRLHNTTATNTIKATTASITNNRHTMTTTSTNTDLAFLQSLHQAPQNALTHCTSPKHMTYIFARIVNTPSNSLGIRNQVNFSRCRYATTMPGHSTHHNHAFCHTMTISNIWHNFERNFEHRFEHLTFCSHDATTMPVHGTTSIAPTCPLQSVRNEFTPNSFCYHHYNGPADYPHPFFNLHLLLTATTSIYDEIFEIEGTVQFCPCFWALQQLKSRLHSWCHEFLQWRQHKTLHILKVSHADNTRHCIRPTCLTRRQHKTLLTGSITNIHWRIWTCAL